MLAHLADPSRAPRSLTVHFVSRPEEGPCVLRVRTQRAGTSLHSLAVRLEQGEELRAMALGAFSPAWTGPELAEGEAPAVPGWETIEPVDVTSLGGPEFFSHVEFRPVLGSFAGGDTEGPMEVGGWLRPAPPEPVDSLAAAFLLDALWPAPYPRLPEPLPAPTIDLSIHFRRALPATPGDEPVFARFSTSLVHEGFFEEDGALWSPDGRLLAQSRQLALLREPR